MKAYAMAQLPERFKIEDHKGTVTPHSEAFLRYVNQKYSQYGFSKYRSIEYNSEFVPDDQERSPNPNHYRWVENVTDGLREVGASHELVKRLGHTGWYTNEFQDETVHGVVYQLPARNGVPQYVPAVSDPNNDNCACIDFHSVTDDKEDAARWADSMAEHWAETEREYQAKESARARLEDIAEEIKQEYQDFRRIAREIRANCDKVQGVSVVRELVRERWIATKEEIRKLRREQTKIEREGY